MALPVTLERRYGLMAARYIGQVHEVGLAATNFHWTQPRIRLDEDADRAETGLEESNSIEVATLLAAMAALGITLDTLLNETQLRNVLRRIARSNDQSVKRQLGIALGRPVNVDATAEIQVWVDAQVERIQRLVNAWYDDVARTIAAPPDDLDFERLTVALAQKKGRAERNAFVTSAAGLLLLNASLVAANALGSGIESYIWRTESDDLVRPHHLDLEGTIQRFDAPPVGGGTTEGDPGNPGDGINCRCVAEVIVTV